MNRTHISNAIVRETRQGVTGKIILAVIMLLIIDLPENKVLAQVVPLDSIINLIDERNPMLREYDSKIQALDEYARGAKSWMAPMVGAGTFMTPYPNQTIMHENEKGFWMLSFEQEIPNPLKLRANSSFQKSKAGVEEQARAVLLNTLRSEAKLYYYQWVISEKKLKVLDENIRIVELMIKLARIRYPYNKGSLGNIYKAEGRLNEVKNMILMTQSDIEEKAARLKALINVPASENIRIDTSATIDFDLSQISNDTLLLRQQRSDIKQINQQIEVMRLNQTLQKYQSKPDFKIRFDHMQPFGEMPKQFTAMAMISIPIAPWSSKMYKSEVRSMQHNIEAMQQEREARLLESRGMLAGMSAKISAMKQQLSNYQSRIIPALQRNYETSMIAYEENTEQLPMVIDGWEALNMAQLEYFNKMDQYYTMIVNYEKVLEK